MRRFRASRVLLPDGVAEDRVVVVDEHDRVVEVRDPVDGDPPAEDGLLIPGLVNAHLHLELSHLGVIGDEEAAGFVAWVTALIRARNESEADVDEAMVRAARDLVAYGTVAVSDISNTGRSAGPLASAGLSGIVQRELLTMDARKLADAVRLAAEVGGEVLGEGSRILIRPSPHALYSTAPALVRACVLGPRTPRRGAVPDRRRAPASIHVAEDRGELRFLRRGDGPFALFLDWAGVEWRWWEAPGISPIQMLDELGVLGPDLLLVHGVHLDGHDRHLIARSGSALCLCVRSNRHITGDLPDVPALISAGVPLCLGTDSLASCPDLDVLSEIRTLCEAFPSVPATAWLQMATEGGARALGLDHLGAIAVGRAPGLILLRGVADPSELAAQTPPVERRERLCPPGVAP